MWVEDLERHILNHFIINMGVGVSLKLIEKNGTSIKTFTGNTNYWRKTGQKDIFAPRFYDRRKRERKGMKQRERGSKGEREKKGK